MPSIKAALDVDWSDETQKSDATVRLVEQIDKLARWVERHIPEQLQSEVVSHLATLRQIRQQDIEATPGTGAPRIIDGVAKDRRVSIEDEEMRHGRKSDSYAFCGYKRHIATDLDESLILAAAITPASVPERDALPILKDDLDEQRVQIGALYIDRGYITSDVIEDLVAGGAEVICRPWQQPNHGKFTKGEFEFDMRARTITCPNGQTQPFRLGASAKFDARICDRCPLRSRCTSAAKGQGREVFIIHPNEPLQHRLRKLTDTASGRARLRERVPVEHRLAHLAQRQGDRARHLGIRKNTFDTRRASAIQNLETAHHTYRDEAQRAAA